MGNVQFLLSQMKSNRSQTIGIFKIKANIVSLTLSNPLIKESFIAFQKTSEILVVCIYLVKKLKFMF